MTPPTATYRVQLNKDFDFDQLREVLPYFAKLGISHVYASPIFQARRGSTHGYDIVEPNRISEELGGPDACDAVCRECAALGLGWIQDIVPNHVSYSTENGIIKDIMKRGERSEFCSFLDVDWNHPSRRLKGKIMAPFLEKSYRRCLREGKIRLVYNDSEGFALSYKDTKYPVKQDVYGNNILEGKHEQVKAVLEIPLDKYNQDMALLDNLISKQVYALTHWKAALKQINYRRFFDIGDLICLCTEKEQVFEEVHRLVFDLVTERKVSGIRVDHVDGLRDPQEYIERLRDRFPNLFLVVEKILSGEEKLPKNWRIQGTTGYDFLNRLNGLFVLSDNEAKFDKVYRRFTGDAEPFAELLYKCKKQVIENYFGGDLENLCRMLLHALQKDSEGSVRRRWKKADSKRVRLFVVELLACFPVYRSYLSGKEFDGRVQQPLKEALAMTKKRNPDLQRETEAFEKHLGKIKASSEVLAAVMRLQQFTGAIMAKGLEDTALYRYGRLLSLNEVGGAPTEFGCTVEKFHAFNKSRQRNWPHSLNATSTHDTKRGEDVRARLNVLSEMPAEFETHLHRWTERNAAKKHRIRGVPAPDRAEEWFIYQTLLGAYPFNTEDIESFAERLKTYLVKALREAKVHSSWLSPSTSYEKSVVNFATELLKPNCAKEFLDDFLPFQKKIAFFGVFNSLSQTLIKITSIGVPDFYQGTELWDLNLVDPDNRRPVNFKRRQKLLAEIAEAPPLKAVTFLEQPQQGKIKLYETYKALEARKSAGELFTDGTYISLKVKGAYSNQIVAFCRRKGTKFAVTVVPRFLVGLPTRQSGFSGFDWKDTAVLLPPEAPREWRNAFTGEHHLSRETILAGELFKAFPTALLLSGEA